MARRNAWATFGYYSRVLTDFIAGGSFPPGGMSVTSWLAAASPALPCHFLMTVTNVVAWTYQYLLPGALLWLGLMATAPHRLPASTPARSASQALRP